VQQRRFSVRLGHETHRFDSAALWEKWGRADILIFYEGRALAVLEVKREGLSLTHEDYEQAQSYANQLTPRPPLVIVTNGHETRVYDANTGETWSGDDDAAKAVMRLLENASKLAASDMRWAIEALMGRDIGTWTRIVRASTAAVMAEMTDPPGEAGRPFTRDLLFPRLATFKALKALESGPTFTVIEGAPVTGKTNLLRELAVRTAGSDELAVLMLRGSGPGLFQAIANLFAAQLEWTLTAADAREWLRRMSSGAVGPALVVAIDGVEPGTSMAADLEELAGLHPGDKLRVILTTDRPEALVKAPNRRTETALGARATRIEVGPLGWRNSSGRGRRFVVPRLSSSTAPNMPRTTVPLGYCAPFMTTSRAIPALRMRPARSFCLPHSGWDLWTPPGRLTPIRLTSYAATAYSPETLCQTRRLVRLSSPWPLPTASSSAGTPCLVKQEAAWPR
jgi:hypothetical protein